MKVSELIMRLCKMPDDLDVYLLANTPETSECDGVIEPVNVTEIISVKQDDGTWKPVRVQLRAEDEDEE